MPQVTRTAQADDDLADLLFQIARHSRPAAVRLRDEIDRQCRLLARFPRTGTDRSALLPGLYSRPVSGRAVIYYRVMAGGIEVVRVLHGSRQVDATLFDG